MRLLFACAGSAPLYTKNVISRVIYTDSRQPSGLHSAASLWATDQTATHHWCLQQLKRLSVEPCRPLQPPHAPALDAAPVGQAQLQQQQQQQQQPPEWPAASGADAASLPSETPSSLDSLVFDAEAAGGSLATPGESRFGLATAFAGALHGAAAA